MHRETLLRLSIEEVNFTSARKTNIAPSVLKAGGMSPLPGWHVTLRDPTWPMA